MPFPVIRGGTTVAGDRTLDTVMRGALGDTVQELHLHHDVPVPNTALGHIVLRPVERRDG